jgi:hypothetical protein
VNPREKLLRLAEKFERDASALADDGNVDGCLAALENHMQCLAIAMLRDSQACEDTYNEILAKVPQLIPS